MTNTSSILPTSVAEVPSTGKLSISHDDDAAPESAVISNHISGDRKLSMFSKMYDLDGDGELDEAELAMRDMDTSRRGHLSNEKVYKMMQDHVQTQRKLFHFKKIIIGLTVLVVILALSNLGTSFAAAILSKDTATKPEETSDGETFGVDFIDKQSGGKIGTQTANDSVEVTRRASSLCVEEDGETKCATDSYMSVPESVVKSMMYKCLTGRTVNVERSFSNGSVKSINICSGTSNVEYNEYDRSSVEKDGASIHFDPMENGDYKVTGDGLLQKETEVCDVVEDCQENLTCDKNETLISGCQDNCNRKRWGLTKLNACVSSCDHATCMQAAVDE